MITSRSIITQKKVSMTNVTTQKKQLIYDKSSYCNPYLLAFEKRKIYKHITSKVNYIKIFFG